MKKQLSVIMIICLIASMLIGCGAKETKDTKISETVGNIVENVVPQSYDSYEAIYNDYTQKIQDATPQLIEEYKSEASSNSGGLEGLAQIANDKVEDLAEIVSEAGEEMASYMMTKGSGKYDEYQEWYMKVYEVYEEEASKIYDVYMNSAVG